MRYFSLVENASAHEVELLPEKTSVTTVDSCVPLMAESHNVLVHLVLYFGSQQYSAKKKKNNFQGHSHDPF